VVTRARPKAPLAGKRSCPTAVPYVAVILLWSTASASLAAAAETRCDCEPPIKAEAIAEGSCVRTQDNGNYCRLRFTTEAAATAALKNGAFQDQLSTAGLKPDTFVVDIKTLEDLPMLTPPPPALLALVARALQSATFLGAWDPGSGKLVDPKVREIIDLLRLGEPALELQARSPLAKVLSTFSGKSLLGEKAVSFIEASLRLQSGVFKLKTSRGCVEFRSNVFTLRVKTSWRDPICDPA